MEKKLDQLYGQVSALEHLVLALYRAHPNKSAVQEDFLRKTEHNATLDLYTTRVEEFLDGFRIRHKILADVMAANIANLPQQP